jgi:hypothetical protein
MAKLAAGTADCDMPCTGPTTNGLARYTGSAFSGDCTAQGAQNVAACVKNVGDVSTGSIGGVSARWALPRASTSHREPPGSQSA